MMRNVGASLVSPVLVGRQAEEQFLEGALRRVLDGEQITAVVTGEAGVGKSRLVHELIGHARGLGLRVLIGAWRPGSPQRSLRRRQPELGSLAQVGMSVTVTRSAHRGPLCSDQHR